MAVRLFAGNLSYSTTEADLRTYFGSVAQPSQVVLPVDRETGRPRGFAFVEFIERSDADRDSAVQRSDSTDARVSEARAREDRGLGARPTGDTATGQPAASGAPRPGGQGPRPGGGGGFSGPPRPFDPMAPAPPRGARNFGPDAKPQRGPNAKAKKKEAERPRGPIPLKNTGRSFSLDDDSPDEGLPDIDDFATSKPTDEADKDKDDKDKDDE